MKEEEYRETEDSAGSGEEREELNGEELDRGKGYPVILVYGFMGFDYDSFFRVPYWGGTVDLEKRLQEAGYPVYTAQIGPVSSNRDRACELYSAIKGGRVDYGTVHSARFGHARYGRSYEGVYPEWGTRDPNTGEVRKVHIIGHSMGGQTARLLVSLLENGDSMEREGGEDVSPLFMGNRPWVLSVTTLSTPHDGTTITYQYKQLGFIQKMFAKWLAAHSARKENPVFDLQLGHWAPMTEEDESLEEFLRLALEDGLWKRMEDFSFYDLSHRGAEKLNHRAPASENVYYFSWATSCTEVDPETGHYVPENGMSLPLRSNARFMGSLEDEPQGVYGPPRKWWENDGQVNTCSMDKPKAGSSDELREFDGSPEKGVWNFMGTLEPYDHYQIHIVPPVARKAPPGYESLFDFYRTHISRLQKLE